MNTELKKSKNNFEKDFFKLMNNAVLDKIWKMRENIRDMKLVITKIRRNYLVSEPNYHIKEVYFQKIYQTYKYGVKANLCYMVHITLQST